MRSPERLEQLLGARPLNQAPPGAAVWRALIDAVDVAPVRLEVTAEGPDLRLELAALAGPVSARTPSPPRWVDQFAVPASARNAFESDVSRGLAAWRAGGGAGVDSVWCRVEVRARGSRVVQTEVAHNPRQGESAQVVLAAFHRLALASATSARARRALDRLWAPLDLGMPATLQPGEPKTLRIFGPLSARHQGDLRNLVGALDPREALVVQMVDCPAVEAALFGDLLRLARRPGPTAFAAPAELRDSLLAAGVPGAAIVSDPDTLRTLFGER